MRGRERRRDAETMEALTEELRATFELQVERLREIDAKAIEILKANLLLIGIFVTGISILVQSGIDVAAYVNFFTVFGGLVLLASTALAGITYIASSLRGGLGEEAVQTTLREGYDEAAFEQALARSYGRWVEYNAEVTAVNDLLIAITVVLVIDSFVFLLGGVVVALAGLSAGVSVAAFLVVLAAVGWISRVIYHMDHIDSPTALAEGPEAARPPFRGVAISKGTSRRQGLDALKRMLRTGDVDDESGPPTDAAERDRGRFEK